MSLAQVESSRGWSRARFDECIKVLLHEGLALVDEQHYEGEPGAAANERETLYWFPCLHGASHAGDDATPA